MVTLWLSDLRHSLRTLRREPLSSFAIVLTLGLGLGVNAAVFSFVEAVLLRPLPAHEPERLVVLWESDLSRRGDLIEVSLPNFLDWRRDARELEEMARWEPMTGATCFSVKVSPPGCPIALSRHPFSIRCAWRPCSAVRSYPRTTRRVLPASSLSAMASGRRVSEAMKRPLAGDCFSRILPSPSFLRSSASCRGRFNSRWARRAWVPARRQLSAIADANGFDERTRRGLGVFVGCRTPRIPKALSTWRRAS